MALVRIGRRGPNPMMRCTSSSISSTWLKTEERRGRSSPAPKACVGIAANTNASPATQAWRDSSEPHVGLSKPRVGP